MPESEPGDRRRATFRQDPPRLAAPLGAGEETPTMIVKAAIAVTALAALAIAAGPNEIAAVRSKADDLGSRISTVVAKAEAPAAPRKPAAPAAAKAPPAACGSDEEGSGSEEQQTPEEEQGSED